MGSCCSCSKKVSAAELEEQERLAREEAERRRHEEDERRRREEERAEAERSRLETIRANYQQGIDVLLLNEHELGSEKSMEIQLALGVVPHTLSNDFQKDRSGAQYLDYLGAHWNKFEAFKLCGWQAGLSHLMFLKPMRGGTMYTPALSAWVRGQPLPGGPLTDYRGVLKNAKYNDVELETLLSGVVYFEKDVAAALNSTASKKKIDFRERVSLPIRAGAAPIAPTTADDEERSGSTESKDEGRGIMGGGSQATDTTGAVGALSVAEPVAHGWLYRAPPSGKEGEARVAASVEDKRHGASFFALCSARWHLVRREPTPGGILGADFTTFRKLSAMAGAAAERGVEEGKGGDGEEVDVAMTDLVFMETLRPALHDEEEDDQHAHAFAHVAEAAECEALYLRSSPQLSLELMPRTLSGPHTTTNNSNSNSNSNDGEEGGRRGKLSYLYQRRYEYVPYIPGPSLSKSHDLHLAPIEHTLACMPREEERQVHSRLRRLVWRIYSHSHRIPVPERPSKGKGEGKGEGEGRDGDGDRHRDRNRNRKRYMLRRKKTLHSYVNSEQEQKQAGVDEVDPWYDSRFPESEVRVTFRGRKRQESEDMCRTLAHLMLFLKAQEHAERELHLLVAREERAWLLHQEEEEEEARRVEEMEQEGQEEDDEGTVNTELTGEASARDKASRKSLSSLVSGGSRKSYASAAAATAAVRKGRGKRGEDKDKEKKRKGSECSLPSRRSSKAGSSAGSTGSSSKGGTRRKDGRTSSLSPTSSRYSTPMPLSHRLPPLPLPSPFPVWVGGLLPSSLGTTQVNKHSLWDSLAVLLGRVQEQCSSGGGVYAPTSTTQGRHELAMHLPFSHPALYPSSSTLSTQQQGQGGLYTHAHLLYPTDGKVHKFSRKQQKKGHHSMVHTSDGRLPADLYITPREIEDDTVGSSFVDPDVTIGSEEGVGGGLGGVQEEGEGEQEQDDENNPPAAGIGTQKEKEEGRRLPPLGTPSSALASLVPVPDLESVAGLPSAEEERALRLRFRRKISYVLTRPARGKADVFSYSSSSASASASALVDGGGDKDKMEGGVGGKALHRAPATAALLRESGTAQAYKQARRRYASFLAAHRQNTVTILALDRVSVAAYDLICEKRRLTAAIKARNEASMTAAAVEAGLQAAAVTSSGSSGDAHPGPPTSLSSSGSGNGAGEHIYMGNGAGAEALVAARAAMLEREQEVEGARKSLAQLRRVVSTDTATLTTTTTIIAATTTSDSGGRHFDLGRYLAVTVGLLEEQERRTRARAATTPNTQGTTTESEGYENGDDPRPSSQLSHPLALVLTPQQQQHQAGVHTEAVLAALVCLRAVVEASCVNLAYQVQARVRYEGAALMLQGADAHHLSMSLPPPLPRVGEEATVSGGELSPPPPSSPSPLSLAAAGMVVRGITQSKRKVKKIASRPAALSLRRLLSGAGGSGSGAVSGGSFSDVSRHGGSGTSHRKKGTMRLLYPAHTDPSAAGGGAGSGEGRGYEVDMVPHWRADLPVYLNCHEECTLHEKGGAYAHAHAHAQGEEGRYRKRRAAAVFLAQCLIYRFVRGCVDDLVSTALGQATGAGGGSTGGGSASASPSPAYPLSFCPAHACAVWAPELGFPSTQKPSPLPTRVALPVATAAKLAALEREGGGEGDGREGPEEEQEPPSEGGGGPGDHSSSPPPSPSPLLSLHDLLLLAFADPTLSRHQTSSSLQRIRSRASSAIISGRGGGAVADDPSVHFRLSLAIASSGGGGSGYDCHGRVAGSISVFYRGHSIKESLHLPLHLSRRLARALHDRHHFLSQCTTTTTRASASTGGSTGMSDGESARVVLSL